MTWFESRIMVSWFWNEKHQENKSPSALKTKYDEIWTGLNTVTTAGSFDDYSSFGLRLASNPR